MVRWIWKRKTAAQAADEAGERQAYEDRVLEAAKYEGASQFIRDAAADIRRQRAEEGR